MFVENQYEENEFDVKLLHIKYDEKKSEEVIGTYLTDNYALEAGMRQDNTIVLHTGFWSGENSGPNEPHNLYTDFSWTLIKDDAGQWKLFTCGYA